MTKKNLLLLLPVFAFASVVLFVSLQSANKQQTIRSNHLRSGKFYVSAEILPDHSLYPLLMAYDYFRLRLANQDSQNALLISYAQRRTYYAKRLAEQEKYDLSAITFSKAIKYLNQAMRTMDVADHEEALLNLHLEQEQFWQKQRDYFPEQEKVSIEDLFTARRGLLI